MIKQHCDICDGVIPVVESYRTVFFGRGTNSKINVGYDPTVVCKKCWNKMLSAVGAEKLMVHLPDKNVETAMVKSDTKREERIDSLAQEIADGITGKDKSCESCVYGDRALNDEPCCLCTGKDRWVRKEPCASAGIKCLDCDKRDGCEVYLEEDE